MSEEALQEVYTDSATLRLRFRELGLLARVQAGELTTIPVRSTLASPGYGLPEGTLTQVLNCFDGDIKVATVHQFLLPDGSIGASGLPDPKWLRDGNTILKYRATKETG